MVISEHPASEYAVIGTRPIRHDGLDKVTGRAVYGADIHLAGLVYGAVLRSPYSHARIVNIDTSKAEAAPGVLAVMVANPRLIERPIVVKGERAVLGRPPENVLGLIGAPAGSQ